MAAFGLLGPKPTRAVRCFVAALTAALSGACSPAPAAPASGAGLPWEACRVGSVGNARCARVAVPEDHDDPDGKTIDLSVAVLPALAADGAPDPFVILVGGPGQAATEVGPELTTLLERVRKRRDVLLVDQRGTGSSSPLDCDLHRGAGREPDRPPTLAETFDVQLPRAQLEACLADYDVDPRHFATPDAVADLEHVRERAGYESLNLFGASYGTRMALAYARRHPDRVRTITLDGVAPVDMALPLPMAADGQRALDLAASTCADDLACRARFPDLSGDVHRLLTSLSTPRNVELAHPRTGARETVTLTREAVAGVLRGALYAPQTTSLVPLVVRAANDGDFAPLAALAVVGQGAGESMSLGMFLSVVCSEDRVFGEGADVDEHTRDTFVGPDMVRQLWSACDVWPRATLPEDYFDPVNVDVPVLVLSGRRDPATPPRWGAAVSKHLPQSRHLELEGMGHGTWSSPCVARIIETFVDDADPRAPDTACIERSAAPPFFVSPAGPAIRRPEGVP